MRTVAHWLHVLHHKEILLTDWLHNALLLSLCWNSVSDGIEIYFKLSVFNIRVASWDTWLVSLSENESIIKRMMMSVDWELLFNSKSDSCQSNTTSWVIQIYLGSADLYRFEDVLIKCDFNLWNTLTNTASSLDIVFASLLDLSAQLRSNFSDNENLFVSHNVLTMMIVQHGLDMILDFGLWLLFNMRIFVVHTWGNSWW